MNVFVIFLWGYIVIDIIRELIYILLDMDSGYLVYNIRLLIIYRHRN